jgi:hypothetical protein
MKNAYKIFCSGNMDVTGHFKEVDDGTNVIKIELQETG